MLKIELNRFEENIDVDTIEISDFIEKKVTEAVSSQIKEMLESITAHICADKIAGEIVPGIRIELDGFYIFGFVPITEMLEHCVYEGSLADSQNVRDNARGFANAILASVEKAEADNPIND